MWHVDDSAWWDGAGVSGKGDCGSNGWWVLSRCGANPDSTDTWYLPKYMVDSLPSFCPYAGVPSTTHFSLILPTVQE